MAPSISNNSSPSSPSKDLIHVPSQLPCNIQSVAQPALSPHGQSHENIQPISKTNRTLEQLIEEALDPSSTFESPAKTRRTAQGRFALPPRSSYRPSSTITKHTEAALQSWAEAIALIEKGKYEQSLGQLKIGYHAQEAIRTPYLHNNIDSYLLLKLLHKFNQDWSSIEKQLLQVPSMPRSALLLMKGIFHASHFQYEAATAQLSKINKDSTDHSFAQALISVINHRKNPPDHVPLPPPQVATTRENYQKRLEEVAPRLIQMDREEDYQGAASTGSELLDDLPVPAYTLDKAILPIYSRSLEITIKACWKSHQLSKALRYIDRMFELQPGAPASLTTLAAIRIQQHKYDEGFESLKKIFDLLRSWDSATKDDYYEHSLFSALSTSFTDDTKTNESLSMGFQKNEIKKRPKMAILYGIFFYVIHNNYDEAVRHFDIAINFRLQKRHLHINLRIDALYRAIATDMKRFITDKKNRPRTVADLLSHA